MPASAICASRTALAMFDAGLFHASGWRHSPTWLPWALALAARIIDMVGACGEWGSSCGDCVLVQTLSSVMKIRHEVRRWRIDSIHRSAAQPLGATPLTWTMTATPPLGRLSIARPSFGWSGCALQ